MVIISEVYIYLYPLSWRQIAKLRPHKVKITFGLFTVQNGQKCPNMALNVPFLIFLKGIAVSARVKMFCQV